MYIFLKMIVDQVKSVVKEKDFVNGPGFGSFLKTFLFIT